MENVFIFLTQILRILEVDGVSGIGSTCGACNDVITIGKDIDKLSFALVSPLGAKYHRKLTQLISIIGHGRNIGEFCFDW